MRTRRATNGKQPNTSTIHSCFLRKKKTMDRFNRPQAIRHTQPINSIGWGTWKDTKTHTGSPDGGRMTGARRTNVLPPPGPLPPALPLPPPPPMPTPTPSPARPPSPPPAPIAVATPDRKTRRNAQTEQRQNNRREAIRFPTRIPSSPPKRPRPLCELWSILTRHSFST
jgi:hypothetical protein